MNLSSNLFRNHFPRKVYKMHFANRGAHLMQHKILKKCVFSSRHDVTYTGISSYQINVLLQSIKVYVGLVV